MSEHSVCFQNGMSGRCDHECSDFMCGDCSVGDEVLQNYFDSVTDDVRAELLKEYYNEVELWTLRGSGVDDETLLFKAMTEDYGYDLK